MLLTASSRGVILVAEISRSTALRLADKSHDHQVDFNDYREWIMSEPQILTAFCQLAETHVLSTIEPAECRSIEDAILRDTGTGATFTAAAPQMRNLAKTPSHGKLQSASVTLAIETQTASSRDGSLYTA